MSTRPYGQVIPGLTHQGEPVRAGVFNEIQVRAAAGLTLALAATAFAYANFAQVFGPIKVVTAFFLVDFSIRVTVGLGSSPTGVVAGWMTRRQPPQWVSAKPKRFAWTMGVIMSAAMTVITNVNIHGLLPRTICLTCLTLMWLEAVLGLCVGCEIYGLAVRRGWVRRDEAIEICADGACAIDLPPPDVAGRHDERRTMQLRSPSAEPLRPSGGGRAASSRRGDHQVGVTLDLLGGQGAVEQQGHHQQR